jgi:hypothetical protein
LRPTIERESVTFGASVTLALLYWRLCCHALSVGALAAFMAAIGAALPMVAPISHKLVAFRATLVIYWQVLSALQTARCRVFTRIKEIFTEAVKLFL